MHRPQAVGLRAVMLSLLVLTLSSTAAVAERPVGHGPIELGPLVRTPAKQLTGDAFELARTAKQAIKAGTEDEACTGWRSTLFPPPTVRILRTNSPTPGVNGTVETVDFRTYVGIVIAAEWPGFYPPETLKAGAIAVKQFAWYYSVVYRGKVNALGECYDMQDNTNDQYYQPEKRSPVASHLRAIKATWTYHLRKTEKDTGRGRFILTGYRAGAFVPCGADADGWRMYQHSAFYCGRDGLNMEQILRTYVEPRLEIVTPGTNDIVGPEPGTPGSEVGDLSAMVVGPKGAVVPHVWQAGWTDLTAGAPAGPDIGGPGLLGWASEDANSDGWYDLVMARRTGKTQVALSIARSNGTGYLAETTWWSGDIGADPADARLLTGDFTGDLRPDAALLLRGPKGAHTLMVWPRKNGSGYLAPVTWWSGSIDPLTDHELTGDVNGDGRNDLIVITDLGEGGRQVRVAMSRPLTPGLTGLRVKATLTDLIGPVVKHTMGDVTRDGRDDILLLVDGPTRTRIEFLKGTRIKAFPRVVAWRSPEGDKLPFDKLKVGTSDVDYDGLTDLIVYRDRGANGTEIITFQTRNRAAYGTLTPEMDITQASIDWNTLRPY